MIPQHELETSSGMRYLLTERQENYVYVRALSGELLMIYVYRPIILSSVIPNQKKFFYMW